MSSPFYCHRSLGVSYDGDHGNVIAKKPMMTTMSGTCGDVTGTDCAIDDGSSIPTHLKRVYSESGA